LEGKKTKPNQTEINWFGPVFGSVQKLKKYIILVWLFIWSKTGPKMLSPSKCCTPSRERDIMATIPEQVQKVFGWIRSRHLILWLLKTITSLLKIIGK
jgi:hypothetical protein